MVFFFNFNMTTRENKIFGCLKVAHAQDYLLTIFIVELGQYMSRIEYRTILSLLGTASWFCYRKRASTYIFGEHAANCRELSGFKYRHGLIIDVFFDIFRRMEFLWRKETPANFLTDPQGCSGVWIDRWKTCLCWFDWSFLLVGLGVGDFTVGHWALKTASNKMAKYAKIMCSDNQHVFIPFTFDTFDFLVEVVNLLKRVQKIMHNNVVSYRSMNIIFQILNFARQKSLTAQLIIRLSFIHM
jgi:hypothetical protein